MFSVPLSFGLPRPGVTRRTALRSSDFPPTFAPSVLRSAVVWLTAKISFLHMQGRKGAPSAPPAPPALAVSLLRDLVLLEFLVQIAARRVDDLRGFRDVPAVLAQLRDEERAFRVVF